MRLSGAAPVPNWLERSTVSSLRALALDPEQLCRPAGWRSCQPASARRASGLDSRCCQHGPQLRSPGADQLVAHEVDRTATFLVPVEVDRHLREPARSSDVHGRRLLLRGRRRGLGRSPACRSPPRGRRRRRSTSSRRPRRRRPPARAQGQQGHERGGRLHVPPPRSSTRPMTRWAASSTARFVTSITGQPSRRCTAAASSSSS